MIDLERALKTLHEANEGGEAGKKAVEEAEKALKETALDPKADKKKEVFVSEKEIPTEVKKTQKAKPKDWVRRFEEKHGDWD